MYCDFCVVPHAFCIVGSVFLTTSPSWAFGDVGVNQLHRAFSFSPFCFDHFGEPVMELGVILDVLLDKKKGSSTDRNGILHQVVLSLLLG